MSLLDKASLIVTPNAYKESKLYSVVPNTTLGDMDVVRATTATRVNSAGLIEVVPRNLVTYSEEFDNAFWTKVDSTITANSTTAPNGLIVADSLLDNATNNIHALTPSITKAATPITYTSTIYAKFKDANKKLALSLDDAITGGVDSGVFNLSTGAWDTALPTPSAGFTNASRNFENVGNGWYRLSLTVTSNSGTAIRPNVLLANSSNAFVYVGNGTGIFIFGAQLEAFSTATEYFPTTTRLNIPRIDYTNGSCPSLLVEPQRTNLLTYSQEFDNAAWVKTNTSVTANSTLSPDGTQNADTLNKSSTGVDGTIVRIVSATATGYVGSIFIKKDTNTSRFPEFFLRSSDALGDNEIYVQLNTSTGATSIRLQTGTASVSVPVLINDYWRISFYALANSNTCRFGIRPAAGTTLGVFNANATGSIIAYGAQLETGTYPTSYIPTLGASSVTRNADIISKTGISSLIGQTEGTIFIDCRINSVVSECNILNSEKNTTCAFSIQFQANQIQASVFINGVQKGFILGGSIVAGQRAKIAYIYKTGASKLFINGVLIATNTDTFTLPSTLDDIFLNDITTYFSFRQNVSFNSVQFYKTGLTDTECLQLTTL